MLSFYRIISGNHIKIEIYCILILIKVSLTGKFIDMKKLFIYDSYFVILDTGLYLYDFNSDYCSLIHEFNGNEYKDSNNIKLEELYYGHKAYIFCLVNEYLFIFNEYTYKLFYFTINEIVLFNGNYYDIMPYKIENNNISFIITVNKETTNLFFYFYNFNISEGINEPKKILFDDMNIQNKMIKCQINTYTTFIICFYHSIVNSKNYLNITFFNIKDFNLIRDKTTNKEVIEIKQIKLARSYNDKFFVCFLYNRTAECLINKQLYEFSEIDCLNTGGWTVLKVYYLNEIDDFMLISPTMLTSTILNNADNTIKKCEERFLPRQAHEYSIIYNNDYQVINYENFSNNYMYCNDITILENNKQAEYIETINNLIDNSQSKEEIITNLNEFIENDMNTINYIDEKNEIIIPKDEMTISFTSTYTQQMNENTNSTTINLGKCEEHLKEIYNISKESNLYILKIDKENKGKNYPLIEYEVFYPLTNGKIEILNLSYCDGINIELSIPIKINDTIDKYNPKSNYYNDICTKANSECNTDITLKDRRNNFIKNNMSLCEDNCELTDYDNNNKKAKCSCNVKTTLSLDNIEINSKNIMKNFIDIKKITNIEVIKCYKIVFKIKNLKNNYGSFIILFIFILYCLCIIIFYCRAWKNLIDEIYKIIEAKNKENQLNKNIQYNKFYIKDFKGLKERKIQKTKLGVNSNLKKIKSESNIMISRGNIKNKKKQNNEKINKDEKIDYKNILEKTESELNSLTYKEALKKDKRSYCQYYWSLLKKKQSILFSFYPNKDYNSQIIKSFLFFFFYASDITVNALFFTDATMHKIYVDSGEFNFSYQLPQIIYSFLISYAINSIIEYLSLSDELIISIKGNNINYLLISKKIINCMEIKFLFFFITIFILLFIFGFYISCFCYIYENTQIHLFKDSLMSFVLSLIYPIFINLVPGIFRIPALSSKKGDKSCMYKFSQFIEFF